MVIHCRLSCMTSTTSKVQRYVRASLGIRWKSVAEVVRSTLRKTDMIARYGGEEFTILLPYTNLEDAYEKVEALRKMIAKHVIEDNLISVSVTASFGISSFDECALTENDLVRTADDALYEAKAAGRNCVMTARRLYEAKH